LLQVAMAAGAAVRVVVLTDGDNNPWPQRWIEKRWHIGPAERARWGTRRREEARDAMRLLGISGDAACFFGLADLGLTDILMRGDADVNRRLAGEISAFRPNLVVLPSLSDRHPDHSAAFILVTQALAAGGIPMPRLLTFAVHGVPDEGGTAVALNPAQRDLKGAAIQAHASQMRLSRTRFLRYAQLREWYRWTAPAVEDASHPLRAQLRDGKLQIRIDRHRVKANWRGHVVLIALGQGDSAVRWQIGWVGTDVEVRDRLSGAVIRGRTETTVVEVVVTIPVPASVSGAGYVKLARPEPGLFVLDRFGWQVVA
jgi:LmbE family N-acetylglucosaminyl deacetylase